MLAERHLFSSWNTVYREMLRCFGRSSYQLAHELVDIELERLTLIFSTGEAIHPDLAVFALGRSLQARTRAIGRSSQIDGNWQAGDPELIFGLHGPGE